MILQKWWIQYKQVKILVNQFNKECYNRKCKMKKKELNTLDK